MSELPPLAVAAEHARGVRIAEYIATLEAALLECATVAGADVSEPPRPGTLDRPPLAVWAVRCVQELRDDYEAEIGDGKMHDLLRTRRRPYP